MRSEVSPRIVEMHEISTESRQPEWEAQASQMARSGAPVRIDAKQNDALQNPRLSQAFSPHVRVNAGPADDERRIQSAAEKNDLQPEASDGRSLPSHTPPEKAIDSFAVNIASSDQSGPEGNRLALFVPRK